MLNKKAGKKRNSAMDFSGIAHDMITPLSVLKSFLEKINFEDDEAVEFCLAAKRSLDKLMGMVEELKAPAEEHKINVTNIDIAELTKLTVKAVFPLAENRRIRISFVGPKNLVLFADAGKIDRVITNLVLNALEASLPGSEVKVQLVLADNNVAISVSDSGCGIAKRNISKIFTRGFTIGKQGGSGIGLDVCLQIAREHGGALEVFSKKGQGSVFVLLMPKYLMVEHAEDDLSGHGRGFLPFDSGTTGHMSQEDTLL